MRFGSICSGIEAASAAWEPIGWKAAWFAEIEKAPCSLLAERFPDTPNYGDMTGLVDMLVAGEIEAPDILCGGTPCQAFSVAGLRRSLDDDRGNLSLIFCGIADAIDDARRIRGECESIIFWENVPGVLNTKDNAFGCFLGALAGEDVPLQPAGEKWSKSGCVYGPSRAIAWRILDAQYFGLAQRRKRVFVIASAREGFDPAQILFEFEGMRRDSAPSREAEQGFTYDVAPSLTSSGRGVERAGETRGQDPVVAVKEPCWRDGGQLSQTLDAVLDKRQTMPDKNRFPAVLQPVAIQNATYGIPGNWIGRKPENGGNAVEPMLNVSPCLTSTDRHAVSVSGDISHTLKDEGFDGSEDGAGRGVPVIAQSVSLRGRDGGGVAELGGNLANALRASSGGGDKQHVLSVHGTQDPCTAEEISFALGRNSGQENAVFAFAENSRSEVRLESGDGYIAGTLSTGGGKAGQGTPIIATQTSKKMRNRDADAYEADAGSILSILRKTVGEKSFQIWRTAILASFQSEEILQSWLHGKSLRGETEKARSGVDDSALSRKENLSARLLRQVWIDGPDGRTSQGRGLAKQLAGEFGEALSVMPHDRAFKESEMQNMRKAHEGAWLLQQALSAIQKMGQPQNDKNKPTQPAYLVRRLMPIETERLQGFPDNWTLVTHNGKPMADGPRYKAIGNSWAVAVVRWIGGRIDRYLKAMEAQDAA